MEAKSSEKIDDFVKLDGPDRSPVLLCLHGGPGMDHSYFFPALNSLQEDCTVISYRQGFAGRTNLRGLVSEVTDTISHLSGKDIFLLGHSWGAALALESLRQSSNKLAQYLQGVILVSPVFNSQWKELLIRSYGARIEQTRSDVAFRLAPYGKDDTSDEYYKELSLSLADLYFSPEFVDRGRHVLSAIRYSQAMMTNLSKEFLSAFDLSPVMQSLSDQLMVLTGLADEITPPPYVKQVQEFASNAQFVGVAGVSHFPFIEQPETFRSAVVQFIQHKQKQRST